MVAGTLACPFVIAWCLYGMQDSHAGEVLHSIAMPPSVEDICELTALYFLQG